MSPLSITLAALFYVATAMLVIGVALKIRSYAGTPAPLKIPTTPAPTTTTHRRSSGAPSMRRRALTGSTRERPTPSPMSRTGIPVPATSQAVAAILSTSTRRSA